MGVAKKAGRKKHQKALLPCAFTLKFLAMTLSILFLGTQMTIGGAQRVLLTQAEWFHARGYRVTVAFFYDKDNLRAAWEAQYPFPVVDLRTREPGSARGGVAGLLRGLLNLWRLLRRERFDIIETFTPDSNLLGLPLAFFARVPVRVGSHHGLIENISPLVERLHGMMINSRMVSALVAVSTRVQQLTLAVERTRPEKVILIPNGVQIPGAETFILEKRQTLRDTLELDSTSELIITVGRQTHQKGHSILLEAIPAVLESHPRAVFALVGDGPLHPALKNQAKKIGIEKSLRFLGTRDDVYALLHAADIFVLPSLSEGLPMALLEAMGMGLPVVATALEGIASVVEDGRHGLLPAPGEVQSLASALARLLSDTALREGLAAEGRRLVLTHYTLERMCSDYEALFLRLYQDGIL
jgi:glycosyltransferase involved in cell wall biosynthesis